jgi:hypothetical protein
MKPFKFSMNIFYGNSTCIRLSPVSGSSSIASQKKNSLKPALKK